MDIELSLIEIAKRDPNLVRIDRSYDRGVISTEDYDQLLLEHFMNIGGCSLEQACVEATAWKKSRTE